MEHYVFWKLRTDPLFRAVDEAAPRQGHILDVGCGCGLVAHWLALGDPRRTLHGIDHDAAKIHVARAAARTSSRLSFEEGDLLATAWPPCDTLLLCDVLHYFPHELKSRILHRAFEALRPGGSLVVRDAQRDDTPRHRVVAHAEQWAVGTGQNKTAHGLHFATLEEHLTLLREAGFVNIEMRHNSGRGSNSLLTARKSTGTS